MMMKATQNIGRMRFSQSYTQPFRLNLLFSRRRVAWNQFWTAKQYTVRRDNLGRGELDPEMVKMSYGSETTGMMVEIETKKERKKKWKHSFKESIPRLADVSTPVLEFRPPWDTSSSIYFTKPIGIHPPSHLIFGDDNHLSSQQAGDLESIWDLLSLTTSLNITIPM